MKEMHDHLTRLWREAYRVLVPSQKAHVNPLSAVLARDMTAFVPSLPPHCRSEHPCAVSSFTGADRRGQFATRFQSLRVTRETTNYRDHSRPAARGRAERTSVTAMAGGSEAFDVILSDFDGVICDSVGESSISAIRAARVLWPDLKIGDPEPWMLDAMRAVRPVVETGYENVLLARMLVETGATDADSDFVKPILKNWAAIRDKLIDEWGVSKERLIEVFGNVRDKWIEEDIDSWVQANQLYVARLKNLLQRQR